MDSFLLCKLCVKPYKDPRILTCFHTFCFSCLDSLFISKKGRIAKVICPLCNLDCGLTSENLKSANKNEHIAQSITLKRTNSLGKAKCFFLEKDSPSFVGSVLKEIEWEIDWVMKRLDEISQCLIELENNSQRERRNIEAHASKCGNKNKEELLHEIDIVVKSGDNAIEVIRTKLLVYLFGLRYHQRKITHCSNNDNLVDVSAVLSESRCFLDCCLDIKNLNESGLSRKFEFIGYPNACYILGKICYTRQRDIASHISPNGTSKIISSLKFDKKLRTAAYNNQRSELFLIFPTCKDIIVLSASVTLAQKVYRQHQDDFSGATGKLMSSDDYQTKRIIVARNLDDGNDAVVCSHYLFISERNSNWLHRIPISMEIETKDMAWNTGSYNNGLSVTPVDTLLVACNSTRCIIEYTTEATKIRTIKIPFGNPRHALFLPKEFNRIACNASPLGKSNAATDESCHHFAVSVVGIKHDITIINSRGEVVSTYSGSSDKLNYPVNLALINKNSQLAFLVCDKFNRRLLLLSQDLIVAQSISLVFEDELKQHQDHSTLGFLQTFYSSGPICGKTYKIKCPAKTFVTEEGVVFIIDEDNSSLLRLESPFS